MASSLNLVWAGAPGILRRWKAGKRVRQDVSLEPGASPATDSHFKRTSPPGVARGRAATVEAARR